MSVKEKRMLDIAEAKMNTIALMFKRWLGFDVFHSFFLCVRVVKVFRQMNEE